MAFSNHDNSGYNWWRSFSCPRFNYGSIYIYSFLDRCCLYILGISAFYHDSAACLIKNGEILAAAQEERFTRKKHDAAFPVNAIKYCLTEAGINAENLTNVVFYEKPFLKFERLVETWLAFAPRGFKSFSTSLPIWVKDKLFQKQTIVTHLSKHIDPTADWKEKLLFSEHHLSHAASAFFPSPFNRAAVICLDGVGEWATTSLSIGADNTLRNVKNLNFPHSLGLLYSAFTYYTGFKVNSGEYKLMGLAPYGEPKFVSLIKDHLINVAPDGSYQLNMEYFDYATGLRMTNERFHKLFGGAPRAPETHLSQKEMDIAASIQVVTEEVIVSICKHVRNETNETNLCLSGGVALNCVANGVVHKENIFENIWVQPAAGDAGGALGAALAAWHLHHKKGREARPIYDDMKGAYLGPDFAPTEIEKTLIELGADFTKLTEREIIEKTANCLEEGKAIGWFQGRMEFGPRSLGNRSILGNPQRSDTQKDLNLKVKFRESFRPFAPSVLAEKAGEWFDNGVESPYMLFVAPISDSRRIPDVKKQKNQLGIDQINQKRSLVPAITHVDFTARIQTVSREINSKFYDLIQAFHTKTGCPMVVNTSFNVRGEPIVCTPEDAYRCFMGTNLDLLVIDNFMLFKEKQNKNLSNKYFQEYELD